MADPKPAAGKDVAKPGTTAPSSTSKPIIVGHTAQVSDPMVSTATEAKPAPTTPVATTAKTIDPPGSSRPKLTPSVETQEAVAEAEKVDAETEVTEDAEAKADEAHQARTQEILETGEYHVSISQKATKSNIKTFILTMTFIVLIGLVALYLLSDLEIIDLGIKLPFELFK